MKQESIEADLRALKELSNSRGWQLIKQSIESNIVSAAMAMADNPLMTEKEIDFRRGAIFAARGLLTVDAALAAHLQSELLLASAQADAFNQNATA